VLVDVLPYLDFPLQIIPQLLNHQPADTFLMQWSASPAIEPADLFGRVIRMIFLLPPFIIAIVAFG
jgi:hypothetical protein